MRHLKHYYTALHYTWKYFFFLDQGKKKAKSSHQNAICDPVQTHFACKCIFYKLYLLFYCSMEEMAYTGYKSN